MLRHSTAHVLAQAVLRLWPGAHFAIGPVIEDGFYYDFELPGGAHFTDEDLDRIAAEMRAIMAEDQPFVRHEHTIAEGLELFGDQPFKREIIEAVGAGQDEVDAASEGAGDHGVSTYWNSPAFTDLCRGPHVPATSKLGHFALMRVAGAYWRGDEKRQQLQRIYGTAWESEEAWPTTCTAWRRPRSATTASSVWSSTCSASPTSSGVVWRCGTPRAASSASSWRTTAASATRTVATSSSSPRTWPTPSSSRPRATSGSTGTACTRPWRWTTGRYYPKPMNCPMHCLIFASRQRSYRELPLRLFELGTVYRYERAGTLHGLMRIRGFTQDDSHIYCTEEQLGDEIALAARLRHERAAGLRLQRVHRQPVDQGPGQVRGQRRHLGQGDRGSSPRPRGTACPTRSKEGDAAFYGPKIDIDVRDAIGRTWQLSTIQCDFNHPERFDLEYVGADNARHRPIMLHRALFGSIERFFAILVEHYAGALPTWLAPEQVRVLGVRDDHQDYADEVADGLRGLGIRVEVDPATEPLGARIRRAKMLKIPYILVVGDDDVAAGTVGVNRRGSDRPDRGCRVAEFTSRCSSEIDDRGRCPSRPATRPVDGRR